MNKANTAFSSRIASAALAFGIAASTPLFAQEQETSPPVSVLSVFEQDDRFVLSDFLPDEVSLDPNAEAMKYLLYTLALMSTGLAGYAAMRGRHRTAFISAAALPALIAATNPQSVYQQFETEPTEFIIVVDESDTMSLDGRDILIEEALEQLRSDLVGLGNVQIQIVPINNDSRDARERGTMMSAALNEALSTVPAHQIGGIFILSDGQVSDVPPGLSRFLDGVPVHALIAGEEDDIDRVITIDSAPGFAQIDEEHALSFTVHDEGQATASIEFVTVNIYNNTELVQSVEVQPESPHTVMLSNLEIGQNLIELRVEPLDGELTPLNNRITTQIEGLGEPINVLYLNGAPYQGSRVWQETLSANPNVNFIDYFITIPPEKDDSTPVRDLAAGPFPADDLFSADSAFDVIVFDNYVYRGLISTTLIQNIINTVDSGGALLVTGSRDFAADNSLARSPLGDILPILPNGEMLRADFGFSPQVTDDGTRHPVTLNIAIPGAENDAPLPPWYTAAHTDINPDFDGRILTLMQNQTGTPLLSIGEYGQGRVAVLASDNLWTWDRARDGGSARPLIDGLIGWLGQDQDFAEEQLHVAQNGQAIHFELQTLSDAANASITLTDPRGQDVSDIEMPRNDAGARTQRVLISDLWAEDEADLSSFENGVYTTTYSYNGEVLQSFANIENFDRAEMRHTISAPEHFQALAENTDGIVTRLADAETDTLSLPTLFVSNAPENRNEDAPANSMSVRINEQAQLISEVKEDWIKPWILAMASIAMMGMALMPSRQSMFRTNNSADKAKNKVPEMDGPDV